MVEATDRAIAAIKEAFKKPRDASKKLRIAFERGG
jgi:Fe-S cluster assembly iron-binding protein IscA